MDNAVKFTTEGVIELEVFEKDRKLVFSVRDSGIGIDKSDQEFIFDKFRKVEDKFVEEKYYGGTGVGLSIVKQIVTKMNGKISLKSEKGKGSEFSIELPIEA
jgi:signal transduction histidine kinase